MTTSEARVRACLDRIAARDRALKAWAYIDEKHALDGARALDRMPRRGPLHGMPVAIKDIFDTADMPTEYGSPIYQGHRPAADAACVAMLRDAGCVVLGKTVTTEFAQNPPAATRNPHNTDYSPGGSSSGSAAAVADGMVPFALGTQTGGSVIRPAAYCGVLAIKPTFGSINRAGTKLISESIDTIGAFARSLEDLALALHVLAGGDMPTFQADAPRVGLCRTPRHDKADASTHANLDEAADRLARAGARVRDFDMPAGSAELFDRQRVVANYEGARSAAWEYGNRREMISTDLLPVLEDGWRTTRQEYEAMQAHTRRMRRALHDAMREVDFLLTPSAPGEAPAMALKTTGDAVFNRAWSLLGMPCVNVPYGKGPLGLPLGIQLVGAMNADTSLLAWARWTERALA